MYQFNVPDMTCGHCASTITKAVKTEDPKAKVEIILSQHLVKVESSALSQEEIARNGSRKPVTRRVPSFDRSPIGCR